MQHLPLAEYGNGGDEVYQHIPIQRVQLQRRQVNATDIHVIPVAQARDVQNPPA